MFGCSSFLYLVIYLFESYNILFSIEIDLFGLIKRVQN
nr:MAG TPA: hypothetical protein [Caudoviricetes sp.]